MPTQEALIRQLYIKVAGTQLEQATMDDLHEVQIDTDLRLPSMCVLRLHDPGARLTNEGPFTPGAAIEVGLSDEQGRGNTPVFKGEITGVEPDFAEGTLVELTVRAYDRAHRLHRGVHTAAYVRMSDSEIAQQIARDAGLQADVDSSAPTYEHVYQDGQTHMEFLRERARRIGYVFYVRDRTLSFKRAGGPPAETIHLEWGRELRSFRPILSLGEQVDEVQVKGWDPSTKREIVGRAQSSRAAPEIGEPKSGSQQAQEAFGASAGLAVSADVNSQAEADTVAQALLDEHVGAFVEAEGLCYGQPKLVAGCQVELSALGNRFNGKYLVTAATHIWDTRRDYVTRFTVHGRRGETLRELLAPQPSQRRWFAMVGIVTNNDDPNDTGRVKVKFPWLDGQVESNWARVAAPGAGASRGVYWLPEINDEVLVVFEEGDMARPVVLGGLWNGVDAPPAASSDILSGGDVVQRVLVTRTGHKLVFSEQNKAAITLQTAGGHIIRLNDDDKLIEIVTSGGASIRVDDQGHKVSIEGGGEISIQAQTNVTVKAGGNMNLEASGVMTIKGATIQLN